MLAYMGRWGPMSKDRTRSKRILELVAFGVVAPALLYFVGLSIANFGQPMSEYRASLLDTPAEGLQREIVVVFASASWCVANEEDGFREAVSSVLASVRDRKVASEESIILHGLALDWLPRDGFQYLEDYGPFDEISAGRNWYNTTVAEVIWSTPGIRPTVPQILVLERRVRRTEQGFDIIRTEVAWQAAGVGEIKEAADEIDRVLQHM